jgi:DNA invertase Pin-like site-specific DNA recombinase
LLPRDATERRDTGWLNTTSASDGLLNVHQAADIINVFSGDTKARVPGSDDRIYVDHGLTGTNRDRPGLRLALAACRAGDTLVVTKLDRLARSLPDARDILDELTRRNVKLSLGGSIHDPTHPVGRLLFNVLAMVAKFESDLIKMRTRGRNEGSEGEGSAARQAAKAEAEQSQAPATQAELAELFGVG